MQYFGYSNHAIEILVNNWDRLCVRNIFTQVLVNISERCSAPRLYLAMIVDLWTVVNCDILLLFTFYLFYI